MLNKNKINLYGPLFIAAVVLITAMTVGVTVWSIRSSRKNVDQAVNRLSSFYMEELVGKREVVLRDSLYKNFDRLERVISQLESDDPQDQQALRSFLSRALALYGAEKLGLVSENGTVYTSTSTFTDASRYTFLQKDFTEPEIITSNLYGAKKQVIVAVPVEHFQIENNNITACFMQINIDDAIGRLIYEDTDSEGKIFIGLYYKNGENLTSSDFDDIEAGQNLLSYIQTVPLSDTQSASDIVQSFHEGKKGLITIKSDGDLKYIYYIPVTGTDWMLTVMVHDNTIADQLEYTSGLMFQRNAFQLFCTAVLIIAVFLLIGLLNKRNSDMRRRQQMLEIKAKDEEDLKLARDEAQKANNAKTTFLFNMSHDIRTPMNAILGYTDIGLMHTDDKAQVTDSLKKIKTAGGHLLSIINDILEMSRIESGKFELTEHEVDILQAIDHINTMGQSLAVSRSIDFRTVIGEIRDPYIYADELHINEVIINLISNAVKYTPEGGKVSYTITELGVVTDGKVTFRFEIADNGIGMSEEFQAHLFEPFSRESNSTVSRTEGTGLGLSIVKNIVETAHGTVNAKSVLHEGSVFTVEIPFRVMSADEIRRFKAAASQSDETSRNTAMKGKKVLLVEDNEVNREIAIMLLEDAGMVVKEAEDGKIALDILQTVGVNYFDFVLMDIQMPVMDGYEATKGIRQMPGGMDVKIIALSANAFEEDKQKSLSVGMNAHVAKPIDIRELLSAMNRLM